MDLVENPNEVDEEDLAAVDVLTGKDEIQQWVEYNSNISKTSARSPLYKSDHGWLLCEHCGYNDSEDLLPVEIPIILRRVSRARMDADLQSSSRDSESKGSYTQIRDGICASHAKSIRTNGDGLVLVSILHGFTAETPSEDLKLN
jgi:hypothetical protein